MTVKNYGVLKATPVKTHIGTSKSPHFQILVKDDNKAMYRIAVNIESQAYPSNVLYTVHENISSAKCHPFLTLETGFTPIQQNIPSIAIDYIRGDWFDPRKMIPLPPEKKGPNNDLNDKIKFYLQKAMTTDSSIYAFGDKWGPENNHKDRYFGFKPGQGIHDIHMNQGNSGRWQKDNGIYQDGALFIHYHSTNQWIGIFLAFQSQSWCTDGQGNPTKPVEECSHNDIKPTK